ncbi:MAG: hypothetical protein ABFS12_12485 [Bacteroidota bacterium]
MRKVLLTLIPLILISLMVLPTKTLTQVKESGESELTIPWDEFKKLINLDDDEIIISLDTFEKLLAQTGVSTTPSHKLKNGNVVLKRQEFKNLVNRMKPPDGSDVKPPFDYLITKAVYQGKMLNSNTAFTSTFDVHVLKKDAYLKIPVLYQNIAISDIKVNGKPALVVGENGYHNIVLSKAGEYKVTATFSIKSSLDKGPHKIDFSILKTPITLLTLDIPLKNIDVEIPQSQQVQSISKGSSTVVSAVVAQGNYVSVRWRKKIEAAEKIPPKLYSEIYHLVSIEDDVLKINSDINYNILHSEIDAVQILLPENINVLNVYGESVGEWSEITKDDQRLILIPFTYGKKGNVTVHVTAETPLTETGVANLFSGFRTLETVRETGLIGVELNTSAEVIVTESNGLEKIAIQKLPAQLINKSNKPLIMGFKYLKHPYSLAMDVKKHEKIGVPVATINSANAVTLFTEDGKIVTQLLYQVRNSAKQFLEIQLPEDADVWSVFVDNKPVESSINNSGKLLVPLIRSKQQNNRLNTFPVKVVYNIVNDGFSMFGTQESILPAVDLLISQMLWSVYLPNEYSYNYFQSTLEKEEMIRGLNIFAGRQREYEIPAKPLLGEGNVKDELKRQLRKKDYSSKFKSNLVQEEALLDQVVAEMDFSQRMNDKESNEFKPGVYGGTSTGVLPIQIEVPLNGQLYRFAKSLIKPDDTLSFSVIYSELWMNNLLKWIIVLLIALMIYLNRKRFSKPFIWLKGKWDNSVKIIKQNEENIVKYSQSKVTLFVLFALMIIFLSVSEFLALIFFFLFVGSLIYQISIYLKKRKEERVVMDDKLSNMDNIDFHINNEE